VNHTIEEIARVEGGRVVATLLRLTGSLELAEDAYGDAVVEALQRWPRDGIPERPGAWLTTVARRKALDHIRRESRRSGREDAALRALEHDEPMTWHTVRDDQLRLIFTCCHPALAPECRVALALRVLCGLDTVEIARAFLVPEATLGKRITRAKAKIAANRIAYRVPPDHDSPSASTRC
jgi:RNA polymerase sigma-70 factor, ECF subfamily